MIKNYISRFFSRFSAIGMIVLLTACSGMSSQDFNTNIASQHGKPVDLLVQSWGPPSASYRNQDGTTVYQWIRGGASEHFSGASYPWIGAGSHAHGPWNHALWPAWQGGLYNSGIAMVVSRPMTLDRSCAVNVTADRNNRIIGHNSTGMACGSEY